MPPRKKLTREERLEKKRLAERLRYQRIKNDPGRYSQQKEKEKKKYTKNLKGFSGTMKVHQITGSILFPNHLTMKSLSCFCDLEVCNHFVLGTLDFPSMNTKSRLNVDNVYGPESESDEEPLMKYRKSKQLRVSSSCSQPVSEETYQFVNEQPSTSGLKNKFNDVMIVLVRLLHKETEYRYVAMCTGVKEDYEVEVIFCKVSENTGKSFRIDDNDICFVTCYQNFKNLPAPNLNVKGQRIFYTFDKSINVFEKA